MWRRYADYGLLWRRSRYHDLSLFNKPTWLWITIFRRAAGLSLRFLWNSDIDIPPRSVLRGFLSGLAMRPGEQGQAGPTTYITSGPPSCSVVPTCSRPWKSADGAGLPGPRPRAGPPGPTRNPEGATQTHGSGWTRGLLLLSPGPATPAPRVLFSPHLFTVSSPELLGVNAYAFLFSTAFPLSPSVYKFLLPFFGGVRGVGVASSNFFGKLSEPVCRWPGDCPELANTQPRRRSRPPGHTRSSKERRGPSGGRRGQRPRVHREHRPLPSAAPGSLHASLFPGDVLSSH